jgi:light-regulated signal transduction histidine kinase (bacteriophytochrome)
VASTQLQPDPLVDLSQCAREPVHIPGAIQPHGALLVLDPTDLSVIGVSDNAESLLGIVPRGILGGRFSSLLSGEEGAPIEDRLRQERLEEHNPFALTLKSGASLNAIAHRHDGRLIVEFEPEATDAGFQRAHVYSRVRGSLVRLRASTDLRDLCEQTAREVRHLTGFDRVLIYAFTPDWCGEVVAEDCADGIAHYKGLRFPASDIPSQARALYASCRLRIIPTSTYTPAKLVAHELGRPVDLTHACLRSVSPVHLEYMRNMGVTASLGISLMRGDELWGLITCNHESGERFIPYEARTACGLVGEVVSTLIAQKEGIQAAGERASFLDTQGRLLQLIAQDGDVVGGLTRHEPSILDVTHSAGAVLFYNGAIHCAGKTPPAEAIGELISWIERQEAKDLVIESLPARYPAAAAWADSGCGLVASAIVFADSTVVAQRNWLLWFRPEVAQTVSWGGDPNKQASTLDNQRLRPRTSFDAWREEVRLKSAPFTDAEAAAARSLSAALVDVIVQIEAGRLLARKNAALEELNKLKNQLLGMAAHDLRNPIGGIESLATLLLDEPEGLRSNQIELLELIQSSSADMLRLVESFLDVSRIEAGRLSLHPADTDVVGLVRRRISLNRFTAEKKSMNLTFESVADRLLVSIDGPKMGQVFDNLIGNAIKFSPVGAHVRCSLATSGGRTIFSVADEGPGLTAADRALLFRPFSTASARGTYGESSTGLGLAIVKKIVEAHGGELSVQSEPGQGATFSVALG